MAQVCCWIPTCWQNAAQQASRLCSCGGNATSEHSVWQQLCRNRGRILVQAAAVDMGEVDADKPGKAGARAKRLEKVRYEKQARKEREANTYPEWAKLFEDQANNDEEIREILGDSLGNPQEMEKRLRERVLAKGSDIFQPKTGSAIPLPVLFRDFDPAGSYIWFELYATPNEKDQDVIGSVFRSWYLLGRLGAFNTLNMQLTDLPVDATPKYDPEKAKQALPAYFHNIGNIEYQDTLGRVWVDLGTSDPLAWDIIINSLSALSSDHVGIKQLVFGGTKFGDWEEGMTNPADGYQVYKI